MSVVELKPHGGVIGICLAADDPLEFLVSTRRSADFYPWMRLAAASIDLVPYQWPLETRAYEYAGNPLEFAYFAVADPLDELSVPGNLPHLSQRLHTEATRNEFGIYLMETILRDPLGASSNS
jgi:hypothetical protein